MNETLNEDFIINLSKSKNEPKWMLDFRLKSYEAFKKLDNPSFGPKIEIDFDSINYYRKRGEITSNWDKVNCNIRNRFRDLGVIDAEEKYLGGVSNQYESEVIYHNSLTDIKDQGVIFLSTDDALKNILIT